MFRNNYSAVDRLLHDLAFRGTGAQKMAADLEDHIYARQLDGVSPRRPVFVTALPRAGTTLLLEVLATLPGFAAHSYRDMPFVLCPLIWHRLSRSFQRPAVHQPRAHGDGMEVGFDSPEAFEEVIWRAFWPDSYRKDRIIPWSASDSVPDFDDFFRRHLQKLIFLRGNTDQKTGRYVSKNNANIARIPLLLRMFPDCLIVVPFRDPADHTASLLRQHLNFQRLHRADGFARRYMESIGHLEFGEALRPIDFGNWLDRSGRATPENINFWLAYWLAAYGDLLSCKSDKLCFFDYDAACAAPDAALARLAEKLALDSAAPLRDQAVRFRPPAARHRQTDDGGPLQRRAYALLDELRSRGRD